MSPDVLPYERQLCTILQQGLPICARPFAEIAKAMDIEEDEVLRLIHRLKAAGLIRRIRAIVNYRALGLAGTLATAHAPQETVAQVTAAVNALPGVSHNYLRDHHYNLWFTLLARTSGDIDSTLSDLSARFGIDFHSLPAVRTFKLDVRFDSDSKQRISTYSMKPIPSDKLIKVSSTQNRLLAKLQDDLEPVARPFASLCDEGLSEQDVPAAINELVDRGVIRRIAAVVDHHKLGFTANALFVCEVPKAKVAAAGRELSHLSLVSHCYERATFQGWPYNLFAMMHARSMNDINSAVKDFAAGTPACSFQLLPTVAELKKQPVKLTLL